MSRLQVNVQSNGIIKGQQYESHVVWARPASPVWSPAAPDCRPDCMKRGVVISAFRVVGVTGAVALVSDPLPQTRTSGGPGGCFVCSVEHARVHCAECAERGVCTAWCAGWGV